ncbi:MAG TPA: enoyl-CoA hydratase-related protein [Chloroflexia bacterium]|nr:enoyl-CoA hydratase-related protein [Chloroflexia bacterium]
MEYQYIKTEQEGTTFIITLNRPDKLNALSPDLTGEVVQALNDIRGDESVRAIIITGGPKVFAAGADLSKMQTASAVDMYNRNLGVDMWTAVAEMPQPTIAAVAGYALGGGCELAMACDMRIAADSAKFGQPEINVGIYPGAGGTQRLTRLVGLGRAKELVFLGEPINAEEAYRIGLVNKVVPADSLMEEAKKWAGKVATKPPFTLKLVKQVMDQGADLNLEAALRLERLGFISLFGTEDQREGVTAFLEKRKPEFKGR